MDLSVIIPAYNEEDVLPRLLHDIRRQSKVNAEVIVADANSTDKTRAVAEAADATVVEGGMPAAGRNAGAKSASGEVLVFLDADVRIPRTFFSRALAEMREKDAVVATCTVRPMSNLTMDRLIHRFANFFIRINQDRDPHAPGYCILVGKEVFDRTGGFDESLKVAEDHDFVARASEFGPFRLLESTYVKVDVRRFEKEGRIGYSLKAIRITLHRALFGDIADDDTVEYDFGDYEANDATTSQKALRSIERALIRADRNTRKLEKRILSASDYDRATTRLRELLGRFTESIGSSARRFFDLDEEP